MDTNNDIGIGIVKSSTVNLEGPISLESGSTLEAVDVAYETYGELNEQGDNAILLCHALSGNHHAAGRYSQDDKKLGWWDTLVGPRKAFDTNKFFVVCSNFLGGCNGTTGPASVNSKTEKPYGIEFPVITIQDMVDIQKSLMDFLGVKSLACVAGGSMGGMQVLSWSVRYPDFVRTAIPIATTTNLSPQGIAFNEVGRQAIMADPSWNEGAYYDTNTPPTAGLAIARMIGHITYL